MNGIELCNPLQTPADPNVRLEKRSLTFEETALERIKYQSTVGSLMYDMLGSRPDIAYAVAKVSQYSTTLGPTWWSAVKRIF